MAEDTKADSSPVLACGCGRLGMTNGRLYLGSLGGEFAWADVGVRPYVLIASAWADEGVRPYVFIAGNWADEGG